MPSVEPSPPHPDRGERAKARLLESALEVFGEKNLEGATVREIADRAGQNVASISYHFGGKEGLYRAVMESIVHEIRERTGPIQEQIQAHLAKGDLSSDDALELVKQMVRMIYLRAMSRDDTLSLGRLIVREQMKPTPGFEILYEQAIRILHENLCILVGAVIGAPAADPATIIRSQSILGQLYAFCMARETVRRRLRWTTLEGENAESVAAILEENIDILLRGLREKAMKGNRT